MTFAFVLFVWISAWLLLYCTNMSVLGKWITSVLSPANTHSYCSLLKKKVHIYKSYACFILCTFWTMQDLSYSWLNIWILSSIIEKAVFFLSVLSVFFTLCRCFIIYGCTVDLHPSSVVAATVKHKPGIWREKTVKSSLFSVQKNMSMHGKRRNETETSKLILKSLYCWAFFLSTPRIIKSILYD